MVDVVGEMIDYHKTVMLQYWCSHLTAGEVIDDYKIVIFQYRRSHLVVIRSSGL